VVDLEEQKEDIQHNTSFSLSIHSHLLFGEKCETSTEGIQEVPPSYCVIAKCYIINLDITPCESYNISLTCSSYTVVTNERIK